VAPYSFIDDQVCLRLAPAATFVAAYLGLLACAGTRAGAIASTSCRAPDEERAEVVVGHLRSFLTDRDPEAGEWRVRLGLRAADAASVRLVTDEGICRAAQRAREAAATKTLRDPGLAHLPVHAYRIGPYIAVDDPEDRRGSYHVIWLFDRSWRVIDRIGL
jgi:hypothetical protein